MANFAEILKTYQGFPEQHQSLMLSTVDAQGNPHASYAPFVKEENYSFYIFVSGLSPHTAHLKQTGKASILLIDDEATTQQIFARPRLSYRCRVTGLDRGGATWQQIADRFQTRFGEIIDMFRQLDDFQIMQLTPLSGRFVVGFGAAYQVNPEDFSQLIPKAMGPQKP
ncbi:pyridoxamine 5-phosphate oxidase [filamentous cyanobacterium CCP5]|nr:pyridoxamine 5-phosphate oxidase [filamentous cyanobacterium CCP5]